MQFEWEKQFKRYILDDEKTPYFTPVARLSRRQARYELFAYCLLTGMLYAMAGLASISGGLPDGGALGVSLYAFSLTAAAVLLVVTRHPHAAAYCATGPVAALLYFMRYGFHANTGDGDKVLIAILLLLWMRYNFRILAIARTYRDMPEGSTSR